MHKCRQFLGIQLTVMIPVSTSELHLQEPEYLTLRNRLGRCNRSHVVLNCHENLRPQKGHRKRGANHIIAVSWKAIITPETIPVFNYPIRFSSSAITVLESRPTQTCTLFPPARSGRFAGLHAPVSLFRDGVTPVSRSRHHAPTGREIERPAWTFEVGTFRVFGCRHRRAAEISGYQHTVRHVQRAPFGGCMERGIDGIGLTQ